MDIASHLRFEFAGNSLEDLETPVPLIDLDVVERNILRWQARCNELGLANRPHIKTHKIAGLAHYQISQGAKGITVQKLGEAEVMANAGITDMLLTFNVLGKSKLDRLANLVQRTDISVVADNDALLDGLDHAASQGGRELKILVECDTGAARNGVQSPSAAVSLAQAIDRKQHLVFGGLMTYPATGLRMQTDKFLVATRDKCTRSGLAVDVISSGGSPDMWQPEGLSHLTEYRAGTYVYNDRSLVHRGTCRFDDCAFQVLTTVVSVPTAERAIVDAGSKALTSDLLGLEGYGTVQDLDGAPIYAMSEEHGFLDISRLSLKPRIGDLVKITPNHVCPVSNLFERVIFVRGNAVLGAVKVDARGRVH